MIEARHKEHKGLYIFRCDCFAGGNDRYKNFPVWKTVFEIEYDPHPEVIDPNIKFVGRDKDKETVQSQVDDDLEIF